MDNSIQSRPGLLREMCSRVGSGGWGSLMALINYKKDLVEDLGLLLVSYQVGGSGACSVVLFKVVHKMFYGMSLMCSHSGYCERTDC